MAFGWIDFSEEDKRKALNAIHAITESGTVDELGFGRIRDFFSDLFFPGTSTIQTRAKYFIIFRNILDDISYTKLNNDITKDDVITIFKAKEYVSTVELLRKSEKNTEGIIGSTVVFPDKVDMNLNKVLDSYITNNTKWIVRHPYMVYWNGLRQFGYLAPTAANISSISKNSINNYKEFKSSPRIHSQNDDEPRDSNNRVNLELDIPALEFNKSERCKKCTHKNKCLKCVDWINNIKLELTEEEANNLKTMISLHQKDSLLTFLLNEDKNETRELLSEPIAGNYPHTFEIFAKKICKKNISDRFKQLLHAAVDINHLITLARIRYNMILAEDNTETLTKYHEEWNSYLAYSNVKNKPDNYIDSIFNIMFDNTDNSSLKEYLETTRNFFKKFLDLIKQEQIDDEKLDKLIIEREALVKPKTKLKNPTFKFDGNWLGGRELDYRLGITRTLVTEILNPGKLTW